MLKIESIVIDGIEVKFKLYPALVLENNIRWKEGIIEFHPTKKSIEDNSWQEELKAYFRKNKEFCLNYSGEAIDIKNKHFYLFGEKINFEIIEKINEFIFNCEKIDVLEKSFNSLKLLERFIKNFCEQRLFRYLIYRTTELENLLKVEKRNKIILKKFNSYWGRNSFTQNTIEYTSRLFPFSQEIIDSTIYHELVHCFFPHHKKDFWNKLYNYVSKEKYELYSNKLYFGVFN